MTATERNEVEQKGFRCQASLFKGEGVYGNVRG